MKSKLKKIITGTMAIAIIGAGVHNVNASKVELTDIKEGHWATPDIKWAVDKGVIKGYEDKTFRKDQEIKESEFVSVLYNYVSNTDKNVSKIPGHWAEHYYSNLKKFNLPISYNDRNARDKVLTRGKIAQIIASKYAFNLSEENAIHFMYENELSFGTIPGSTTIESYAKDSPVKREQIPSFIRRLDAKGHVTFRGVPSEVGKDEIGTPPGEVDKKPYDPNKPLTPEKPPVNHIVFPGLEYAVPIADKYGYKVDSAAIGTIGGGVNISYHNNLDIVSINYNLDGTFDSARIGNSGNWEEQKKIAKELFIACGVMGNEAKINELFNFMEQHIKSENKDVVYTFKDGSIVSFQGGVGRMSMRGW